MLLSLSTAGISFCGGTAGALEQNPQVLLGAPEGFKHLRLLLLVPADVGGFVKDPDPELLVRWYQAAALQPFFRGHSSKCAKRREPWLFGEEVTGAIRTAVQQRWDRAARVLKTVKPKAALLSAAFASLTLRYCLLPYWYTLFHHSHTSGVPPLRWVLPPLPSAGTAGRRRRRPLKRWLCVKQASVGGVPEGAEHLCCGQPVYDRWQSLFSVLVPLLPVSKTFVSVRWSPAGTSRDGSRGSRSCSPPSWIRRGNLITLITFLEGYTHRPCVSTQDSRPLFRAAFVLVSEAPAGFRFSELCLSNSEAIRTTEEVTIHVSCVVL